MAVMIKVPVFQDWSHVLALCQWRQQAALHHWYLYADLQSILSQKTENFTEFA